MSTNQRIATSTVPHNSYDQCNISDCMAPGTIKLQIGMHRHRLCGKHADQLTDELRTERNP